MRAAALPVVVALLMYFLSVKRGLYYPCGIRINMLAKNLTGQKCAKILPNNM
jgi:hypothetical protein